MTRRGWSLLVILGLTLVAPVAAASTDPGGDTAAPAEGTTTSSASMGDVYEPPTNPCRPGCLT